MHGSTRRAGYPMVSRRSRRWLRWMLTPEDLGGSHLLRHRAGVGGGLPPHPTGDPSLARRGARAVRVTARLGLTSTAAAGPPWPRRRWPDSPIPPFASLARAASSGRCWTRRSHRLRHRAGVGGGLPPHPAGDSSLAHRGVRAVRVTTRLGLYRSYGHPWPRRRWPDSPIPIRLLGASGKLRQVLDSELAEPGLRQGTSHRAGRPGPGARTTSQWDANATAQSAAPPQDSRRRRMG